MNKIGWCDMTWNPVIGCKNNCNYCYAREINKRFKFINNWNRPEWREKSFNKKLPIKPQRIFVGSMSEIYYWDEVWIEMVIEKVKQYPQHTFQFLTRHPEVYCSWSFPENCWLGVTLTKSIDIWEYGDKWDFLSCIPRIKYISIEPILEEFTAIEFIKNFDWVIIGAETGNRKGKVDPNLEWVYKILTYCDKNNIPVYVKDSIMGYCGIKEFPKENL